MNFILINRGIEDRGLINITTLEDEPSVVNMISVSP
jgi:hypothetical protein